MGSEFPTRFVLWRGVVWHATISAIASTKCSDFARLLSWDGTNFVVNRMDGTYGAIVFKSGIVIGAFFDVDSDFSPFKSGVQYDITRFFTGMPAHYWELAESSIFRFNRQNYRGEWVPIVTAAFWDRGEFLTATLPWREVLENGAHVIRVELIDSLDTAVEEWRDAYQLSSEQISLFRSLVERGVGRGGKIALTTSEVAVLEATSESPEAMADCRRAFEIIGIQFPAM